MSSCTGRRAFSRDTAPETMTAILNEDPPDLGASAGPIPPALVRIVDRCLEKNPSARFQTASDLAFALEPLSNASSVIDSRARRQTSRTHGVAWLGRRRVAAGDAAASRVPARPRATGLAQPDAIPDFPDRGLRGAGKFRPVSGRPSPGVCGARSERDRADLGPGHGFAGGAAPSRLGDRRLHASPVLVPRRTVRRVPDR